MFGKKSPAYYEAKVELLEKENTELKQQVRDLQRALVSATAPEAYYQMLAEEAEKREKETPVSDEEKAEKEFTRNYISEMEAPLFRGGMSEFRAYLERGGRKLVSQLDSDLETAFTSAPSVPESLHNNSES